MRGTNALLTGGVMMMNAELGQALNVIETGLEDVLADLQSDRTTQDRETLALFRGHHAKLR
jgi:hypothetical protein